MCRPAHENISFAGMTKSACLAFKPSGRLSVTHGGGTCWSKGAGSWLSLVFVCKGCWLCFHWKIILLPARITEYVVVHEISHLYDPHHTPAFWLRIERAMPDYAQRRAWLAEHKIDFEGT